MLYEDAPSPFAVVFDEFHYMNDPSRGTVWEESVISSSENTKLAVLSATVSNDEQLKGWMRRVHGPTEVVSSSFRPVPLKYEFACGVLGTSCRCSAPRTSVPVVLARLTT